MRTMMSVLWQVNEPLTFSFKNGSGDPSVDREKYITVLEPGKIYAGLPYTHGGGDDVSFAQLGELMQNGVLSMDRINADLLSGSGGTTKVNNIARIGNNCADAVFAAWSVVSSSITFANAANMTPKNGCIPVGDYKTVDDTVNHYGITRDICMENGEDVMYASYAQLQIADGLSVNTEKSGAHAMLVAQVNVVRDGDKIDPQESYVLIHDQTGSYFKKGEKYWDDALGSDVYIMGGVDRKYTFQRLFNAGYLPVTCKEFIDPSPLPVEIVTDSEAEMELNYHSLFDGVIMSNYWIVSVTAQILDSSGSVVQQGTCYNGDKNRNIFYLPRFTSELEQSVINGTMKPYMLERGDYTLRLHCRLSTGAEFLAREITFTK